MNEQEQALRRYMAESADQAAEELKSRASSNSGAAPLTRELTERLILILESTSDLVTADLPRPPVSLHLLDVGQKKIQVIKELRSMFSLSLKEAKRLTDVAPTVVAEEIYPEAAREAAEALRRHGAEVEIR